MPWCDTCGGHMITWVTHNCPPIWRARVPDHDGDDYREIRARDAEHAAEKYAEEYDQGGDYYVVGGSPIDVIVADADGQNEKTFNVKGEAVPQYTAREISDFGQSDGGPESA